jgi:general secretion pathway protein F
MGAFSYQALNEQGKKVKGVLEGDSARQIRSQLREKNLKPIEVVTVSEKNQKESRSTFSKTRISSADLSLLTRQLATLIQSNLPLDEALAATAQQSRKQNIKSLMLEVRSRVVEGHTLAYALGESPRVFNDLYRSMVRAGEHAGFLGLVLDRLADYTENRQYTQQKLKMAMIYPFILVGVALAVISALMVFVVPKLLGIFENSGAELPVLTRALVASSDFISSYGVYVLVIIVGLVFAFRYSLKDEERRKRFHKLLLRIPFISGVLRSMDTARFASTLSILMASGVPLLEGLKISGEVLSNLQLRESSAEVASSVQEGSSLHRALDQSGEFPPMMVHMVASGEASGELETMLERASKNQERELEMTLSTLMGILEPLLVVGMGGMVLMIVLAVLLPMFNLNTLIN